MSEAPEPVADPSTAPGRPDGPGVALLCVDDLDEGRRADWDALHAAQQGVANPFASRSWVTAWYRHYVPRPHRMLLWITDRDQLVGVAPLYRQELGPAALPLVRRIGLVGSGRSTPLEIPPLLCAPHRGRAVTRAVVRACLRQGVTWSELCLSREHGWLGAHEAGAEEGTAVFSRHQQVRSCVVMPLRSTWDETRSGLRRNVKESVRRARNRLAKDGRPFQVRRLTGTDLDEAAVRRLMALHAARAAYDGSTSRHHDVYADPAISGFMLDVLPRLGRAGEAWLMELELGGRVAAAQLVLRAPGTIYFHSSGFLPQEWALSPVTGLQVAAMQAAIDEGLGWVNFSPGPNEAKLRWSEGLAVYDDIAFGAARRAALARYTAFFLAKDVRQLRHERAAELAALAGEPGHR